MFVESNEDSANQAVHCSHYKQCLEQLCLLYSEKDRTTILKSICAFVT